MSGEIRHFFLVLVFLVGCSTTTKPCSGRSDFRWPKEIKGDKYCYQKKLPSGELVAHGEFIQKHKNGKIALKGQFDNGKMDGIWSEYDENGEKKVEKYFERGVEKGFLPAGYKPKKYQ